MENIFDDVVAGEDYKLLFAVVQRGFSDEVVQASRDNGGSGAVILQGKVLQTKNVSSLVLILSLKKKLL